MKKIFGFILIIISLFIIIFVIYINSGVETKTRIFSSYSLLTSSWQLYKQQFINKDGRVIDTTQNNITTSEGQSYALLRSVWVDDKESFDLVWKWTKVNLKRSNDHLFAWKWGSLGKNKYGVLVNGGINSASDADSDIALALILASRRWHNPLYLNQALPIINDLWNIDTATANNNRYLIAGNWAQDNNTLIVNVSYFAPYAWRIFSTVDKKHAWNSLINPAYALLQSSANNKLDKSNSSGLVPDWLAIERNSGNISATNISNLTTNYSYDAMRTPWRIALDYEWNKDNQALKFLKNNFQTLKRDYDINQTLVSTYSHDGKRLNNMESPSMYATSLGYFMYENPKDASTIYQNKIIELYSNDSSSFNKNLHYYDQNWLWFSVALYNGYLSNFTK